MTNTAKILAAILALSLIIGLGGDQLYDLLLGEAAAQKVTLNRTANALAQKQLELRRCELVASKIDAGREQSLHTDPAKAQVHYQEFLVQLTEACKLTSVVISNAEPEAIDGLGHILPFSVQGSGETAQIGKLIDAFHKTDELHRLSHVNVFQSSGPDSPTHGFHIDVELLTLDDAEKANGNRTIDRPESSELKNLFAERDIFRRSRSKPKLVSTKQTRNRNRKQTTPRKPTKPKPVAIPKATPKPKPPAPPKPDPREFVRLVGIITEGQSRAALFYDLQKRTRISLRIGASTRELGIPRLVTKISSNSVILEDTVSGDLEEVQLGRRLLEAASLETTAE